MSFARELFLNSCALEITDTTQRKDFTFQGGIAHEKYTHLYFAFVLLCNLTPLGVKGEKHSTQ